MRDAIVISGLTWEACGAAERLSLSLASLGCKVLYCEKPTTLFKKHRASTFKKEINGFLLRQRILTRRVYRTKFTTRLASYLLANEVVAKGRSLGLNNPIVFFYHTDSSYFLAEELKRRGYDLVYNSIDYELKDQKRHVRLSNITLAIESGVFEELRQEFGTKVYKIREFGSPAAGAYQSDAPAAEITLPQITGLKLLYFGNIEGRVEVDLLRAFLQKNPTWNFISFGKKDYLKLPNSHLLPWMPASQLPELLDADTIGFLPYSLKDVKNLHCAPVKLFDFFIHGIPVVSTPILFMKECEGLAYCGETVEELTEAVLKAMAEPLDSPIRSERIAFAELHSLSNHAKVFAPLMIESEHFPPAGWYDQE